MLFERLYSLGRWAKANPVKTTLIGTAVGLTLAALLSLDVANFLLGTTARHEHVDECRRYFAAPESYVGTPPYCHGPSFG